MADTVRRCVDVGADPKRKQPKVYIDDSGSLHTLLDIDRAHDLERHPKVGASWEGGALRLDRLDVVYPGEHSYPLGGRARAVGIARLWADLRPLR